MSGKSLQSPSPPPVSSSTFTPFVSSFFSCIQLPTVLPTYLLILHSQLPLPGRLPPNIHRPNIPSFHSSIPFSTNLIMTAIFQTTTGISSTTNTSNSTYVSLFSQLVSSSNIYLFIIPIAYFLSHYSVENAARFLITFAFLLISQFSTSQLSHL